jgi:hypothetical protein
VEAGLWHAAAVDTCCGHRSAIGASGVLLELPDGPERGVAAASDELLALLGIDDRGRTGSGVPVLLTARPLGAGGDAARTSDGDRGSAGQRARRAPMCRRSPD